MKWLLLDPSLFVTKMNEVLLWWCWTSTAKCPMESLQHWIILASKGFDHFLFPKLPALIVWSCVLIGMSFPSCLDLISRKQRRFHWCGAQTCRPLKFRFSLNFLNIFHFKLASMFSGQMLALQKNAQNWPGWKDVYFPCSWQQKGKEIFQYALPLCYVL